MSPGTHTRSEHKCWARRRSGLVFIVLEALSLIWESKIITHGIRRTFLIK